MELVVVVAILGGLSVATSRIFFSSLDGTQRTQSIISVRQAGDSALLIITKRLRNTRAITSSCINDMNSITFISRDPAAIDLTSSDTISTTISCSDTSVTPNIDRILINIDGVASFATPENMKIDNCHFDCDATRSEEHTSELQSHSFISYAVFFLKKK